MRDLKEMAIRGGAARLGAQVANFVVRVGSLTILARLLSPKDFGLVGMVTAFTAVLSLFRDFGLSSAAVQRPTVTDEQVSTLFWINMAVGVLLGLLGTAMAPLVAHFYHEPRLLAVTVVLAFGFFFNAAGTQHSVLLLRQMRFTALALIGVISLVVSAAIGIGGAKFGYGYWALVAMTVTMPLVNTMGLWFTTRWVPGLPQRGVGIRSMMRFGGVVTLNGLIVYVASNFEKMLLGRYWGADAIGLYGRAYQLISIPTDNLNSAAGEVAFSGLSRIQHDPIRLRSYFLKGYSIIMGITLPVTAGCALFADDTIHVLLGRNWDAAIPLFRLLAPTILVFGIANPLSWLLTSTGQVGRLLKMGLVIAPIMIASYFLGLPYGPQGVALAYSIVMVLWVLPLIAWITHGAVVSFRDVMVTTARPLASAAAAGAIAFAVRMTFGQSLSPFPRLILEGGALAVTFLGLLLYVAGQKTLYLDLLRGLMRRPPVKAESLVSV
ncbi:MAG TPA: lipopolysaccharide biosynthesis protein [Terriglobia bacterium]|nr:lipopolysaccharide biosynthesis protein [Terriglobia bacterium]